MKTMKMTRKEWIDATKRKLDEFDESLAELEGKGSKLREQAAADLEARLVAAREGLRSARARWTGVQASAAETWDSVSDEITAAWDVNRDALERSISEIRQAVEKELK